MSTNLKDSSLNAVDLLEEEDRQLPQLFTQLRGARGGSVDEQADYGDLAKETMRWSAPKSNGELDEAAGHSGVDRRHP